MVDVKELRIGNWVSYLGNNTRTNSISVGDNGGYVSTFRTGAITQNQIEPISLTEELLLKCGFEWDKAYKAFRSESFCPLICKNDGTDYWRIDTSKEGYHQEYDNKLYLTSEKEYTVSDKPIEYLHQLQNIYYALTGKELEVEL